MAASSVHGAGESSVRQVVDLWWSSSRTRLREVVPDQGWGA